MELTASNMATCIIANSRSCNGGGIFGARNATALSSHSVMTLANTTLAGARSQSVSNNHLPIGNIVITPLQMKLMEISPQKILRTPRLFVDRACFEFTAGREWRLTGGQFKISADCSGPPADGLALLPDPMLTVVTDRSCL